MAYEFRKVKEITKSQLDALQAQGWEYVDEVKKKDGKTGTGILRFRRERVEGRSDDDVILSPKSVAQRSRAKSS